MFVELTIKEAKKLLSHKKIKLIGAENCKLCYVEKVAETISDWSDEAKRFWKTDPEYLAWKKRDTERQVSELKEYGSTRWEPSPWEYKFHLEYLPNPELKKGTYVAYFTTIPLEKQWGDDWDDTPYEHNAGIPYDDIVYGKDENGKVYVESYKDFPIYKVYFTPKNDVIMPMDYSYGGNSPFSVNIINKGAVAWLFNGKQAIHGGTNIAEFIKIIGDGF